MYFDEAGSFPLIKTWCCCKESVVVHVYDSLPEHMWDSSGGMSTDDLIKDGRILFCLGNYISEFMSNNEDNRTVTEASIP